jgi:hypothetical protein
MRITRSVSVSFDPALLEPARAAAKSRHQSFSGFLASLIEAELDKPSPPVRKSANRRRR